MIGAIGIAATQVTGTLCTARRDQFSLVLKISRLQHIEPLCLHTMAASLISRRGCHADETAFAPAPASEPHTLYTLYTHTIPYTTLYYITYTLYLPRSQQIDSAPALHRCRPLLVSFSYLHDTFSYFHDPFVHCRAAPWHSTSQPTHRMSGSSVPSSLRSQVHLPLPRVSLKMHLLGLRVWN